MLAAISAFLQAIANALGWAKQRDAEKNTEQERKAVAVQQSQDQRDKDAVLDGNAIQTADKAKHDAALAKEREEDSL